MSHRAKYKCIIILSCVYEFKTDARKIKLIFVENTKKLKIKARIISALQLQTLKTTLTTERCSTKESLIRQLKMPGSLLDLY